ITGSRIEYLFYDGDGPVIIMLHATGFLPWLWHPIAKKLAGSCRIIAPYFCDHRLDEPEDGVVSWLSLAKDLCDFCKVMEIDKPLLAGHSMGATVITIASAIYGSSAEKIIMIEPIYLPEHIYSAGLTVEQHPLASKAIKRRNRWTDRDEALEYLRSKPLFASWDSEALELYLNYGMVPGASGGLTLACSPRRETALFMGGLSYNPWPLLHKITSPTLILEGENSENRAYIDLKKAASLMKNGTYRLVKEARHLIPMEKPVETANIFKEFFDLT
ncbi:MAG: alpha/beta hydrolase, partial [Dethiobacteria bacterium]|nr:alpha/beta hydrolase [Dethiobacteria bacterium]